jgi:hypothetical protein
MWVLRIFDKTTDELVGEVDLPSLNADDVEVIVEHPRRMAMVSSSPIGSEEGRRLRGHAPSLSFDFERLAYFLDYDAEEKPVVSATGPS